jgi:O-antigen biosynthesis protein
LNARLSSNLGSLLIAPNGFSLVPAGGRDDAWRSLGPDTRFNIDRVDHTVIPAGWHVLRLHWRALEGDIMAPALYPDYGDGFRAEEVILLPSPDAADSLEWLVLFKYPVKRLQFRPTLRCAEFTFESFELEQVGRATALWKMLRTLGQRPDRDGNEPGFWAVLVAFASLVARRGVSAAAGTLLQLYGGQLETTVGSYDDWVRQYDGLGPSDLVALDIRARELQNPPLISILLPVYNTPERWLRRCIESILAQANPHWELCIADDASPAPHVQAVLQEYAGRDQRIRVSRREQNGHISAASNTALDMATGEFVALLDHDDELRPQSEPGLPLFG